MQLRWGENETWIFPFLRTRDAIHESDGTGRTGKGCGLAASVMVGADRGMLARGQMLRQYPTEVHRRTDCCVPRNGDLRPHFPLIVSPLFISKNFRVCVLAFSVQPRCVCVIHARCSRWRAALTGILAQWFIAKTGRCDDFYENKRLGVTWD